jgi:hypothetical protein
VDFAGPAGVLRSRLMLSSPPSQRLPLTSTLFRFRTPSKPLSVRLHGGHLLGPDVCQGALDPFGATDLNRPHVSEAV